MQSMKVTFSLLELLSKVVAIMKIKVTAVVSNVTVSFVKREVRQLNRHYFLL